jgi:predicted RNA-binding Zn ribbon-like protein
MSLDTSTSWIVDRAIQLVNLLADPEPITGPRLHEVLAGYGYDEDELDVAAFTVLASRLHELFERADPAPRIGRINDLIRQYEPLPCIVDHDGMGPHFHWVVDDRPPVEHISTSMTMGIATAVVERGADRFGWCAAPACERLFFDRSRNRSQRYCSRSCATRVNVRAYRARA